MSKKKLKVGDRISWKSYKRTTEGTIIGIDNRDLKKIKARRDPKYKDERVSAVALYERNVTLLN